MKHDLASIKTRLASAPSIVVHEKLIRIVSYFHLTAYNLPDWLYVSGRAKRYNPAGVNCIYFGKSFEVANAEYESALKVRSKDKP